MSKRVVIIGVVAFLSITLHGTSLLAKTVAVGDASCRPDLQHYLTIQAAVDAVPAGSTVLVCPGTYPEQVVIDQPLILQGVGSGTGGAAVITVPGAGLIPNATTTGFGIVAAQLLVHDAKQVKVINITIDGTGSTCSTAIGANRTAGIEFLNVGDPGAPDDGTIKNVVVRHVQDGCLLGEGIVAENSYVTIDSNDVHDIDNNGIVEVGGTNKIVSNTIQSCGQNGIGVFGASKSSVSGNLTANARYGVYVDGGTNGVKVTGNIIGAFSSIGIYLSHATNADIIGNRITSGYIGLELNESNLNNVSGNTVTHSEAYGVVDVSSGGGNQITNNTINETPVGLLRFNATVDKVDPNTFLNVAVTTITLP